MKAKVRAALFAISFFITGVMLSVGFAQQQAAPTKAVQLVGLMGVPNNTAGNLKIDKGKLSFNYSASSADLSATSIEDVVTGNDSQRVIRGTLGFLSQFAPYESGRFLSLFRSKIDTLTIKYSDAQGGLHGVIFTLPVGTADGIKKELVEVGAHADTPTQANATQILVPPSTQDPATKLHESRSSKIEASAIKVNMIDSDEVALPAEFQVSLYENLIQQLQKKREFHIYREGDPTSSGGPKLILLSSTVRGFKKGSEMARQVTTVAGATSITVHCEFTDGDGRLLLVRDIHGKVRFFGGNLKATDDFAKKAANVTHKNFSPSAGT